MIIFWSYFVEYFGDTLKELAEKIVDADELASGLERRELPLFSGNYPGARKMADKEYIEFAKLYRDLKTSQDFEVPSGKVPSAKEEQSLALLLS